MSDDEDEEPAVELGEHTPVEGAPLARVAARLSWPKEASEVRRLEGDSVVRTPDGPRALADLLDDVEETYFERRQEFVDHVRGVIGTGPIPTTD